LKLASNVWLATQKERPKQAAGLGSASLFGDHFQLHPGFEFW
jgi:hypothetical protein